MSVFDSVPYSVIALISVPRCGSRTILNLVLYAIGARVLTVLHLHFVSPHSPHSLLCVFLQFIFFLAWCAVRFFFFFFAIKGTWVSIVT